MNNKISSMVRDYGTNRVFEGMVYFSELDETDQNEILNLIEFKKQMKAKRTEKSNKTKKD